MVYGERLNKILQFIYALMVFFWQYKDTVSNKYSLT